MTSSDVDNMPAALPSGVVELREDLPLKAAARAQGGRMDGCLGGLRLVVGCFAALTVAVTIALATQIYYGDYELVPHGSVAADAAQCSRAGTDALKAGGGAVDAALAAALCLAVVNPHTTGLDAGGVIMIYDYRKNRQQGPTVIDFTSTNNSSNRTESTVPKLIMGLAYLHQEYGKLPWFNLVKPAVDLARKGFIVPQGLVSAIQTVGENPFGIAMNPGLKISFPVLADYLDTVANQSSKDLSSSSSGASDAPFETKQAAAAQLGSFTLYTPPNQPAVAELVTALRAVLTANYTTGDKNNPEVVYRLASSLLQARAVGAVDGTASNVAVIDRDDVYVSLVTGLSGTLGSRRLDARGFLVDDAAPSRPLAPLMLAEQYTCGRRFVLGSNDVVLAAQVILNLIATDGNLTSSVESPRFSVLGVSDIGIESSHPPFFSPLSLHYLQSVGRLHNATLPYSSCNVVQQLGDALSSHSDSRGGGIASRF